MSFSDDIATTGQPPAWKTAALATLRAQGYEMLKPYAVGGGAEGEFLISHAGFFLMNDSQKSEEYAGWLVDQGIYGKSGIAGLSDKISTAVKTGLGTSDNTPKLITLAVVGVMAFIAWRAFK